MSFFSSVLKLAYPTIHMLDLRTTVFVENNLGCFFFSFPVLVLRVYPIRELQENNGGLKFAGIVFVCVVMPPREYGVKFVSMWFCFLKKSGI